MHPSEPPAAFFRETTYRNNELFRLIAENAADLIAVVDANGRRVYNSPSYSRVLGFTPEELRANWSFAEIHPEDLPRVLETAAETFRAGVGRVVEYRMRHKDGSWRTLQSSGGVIRNRRGEVEYLVIVAHDITERKQSEEVLKRRADEFAALYEITHDLTAQYNLPTLLQTILERGITLLRASGGVIYLYSAAQQDLELVAAKNFDFPLGTRFPLNEGLASRVVETLQPLIVNDYRDHPLRRLIFRSIPITAVIEVPLIYAGELIGVLGVVEIGETTRQFTERDARLLSLFAGQAASAVHNAQLFVQLLASRERQKNLALRLIVTQETERRHLARELHDEIGQAMTGVQLALQAIEPELAEGVAHMTLQDAMRAIEQMLQQVRSLSLDLHPSILDDFGLVPALRRYLDQQAKRTGLDIRFTADTIRRMPTEIETVSYRVILEAITNVIRHAGASAVTVRMKETETELNFSIRDDGCGFDASEITRKAAGKSLGLLGMSERVALIGGMLDVQSSPGGGTVIEARLPTSPFRPFVERRTPRRGSK